MTVHGAKDVAQFKNVVSGRTANEKAPFQLIHLNCGRVVLVDLEQILTNNPHLDPVRRIRQKAKRHIFIRRLNKTLAVVAIVEIVEFAAVLIGACVGVEPRTTQEDIEPDSTNDHIVASATCGGEPTCWTGGPSNDHVITAKAVNIIASAAPRQAVRVVVTDQYVTMCRTDDVLDTDQSILVIEPSWGG